MFPEELNIIQLKILQTQWISNCCCSVAQSCPTLCHGLQSARLPCPSPSPRACSNSWVDDAIQPSHPLLYPSPAFSLSQDQGLSQWVSSLPQVAKYWSFSFSISPSDEYTGLISFRMDWIDLLAVQGTLKSLLQHQFKSINSSSLSVLYGPTLTSIRDCWKNHSLD